MNCRANRQTRGLWSSISPTLLVAQGLPACLHHFVFTIINGDHYTEDWTFMLPGDKLLHAHFDLRRANDSVRPPAQ